MTNLSRQKVFYFAILLVVGVGVAVLYIRISQAATPCSVLNGNPNKTFEQIVGPGPVTIGATVTYTIKGCGMEEDDEFIFSNGTYTVSAWPYQITSEPNSRTKAWVEFDLSPLRDVGYYDMSLIDQLVPDPPGGTKIYNKTLYPILAHTLEIFSSDVIGWGWFGASVAPGTDAAPGWLSLNCQTSGDDPSDNCYNPTINTGVDFGLALYWRSVNRSELSGYAWFGTSEDDNDNSNDNTVLGWIRFDDPGPYPSTGLPAGVSCDGNIATPACEPTNSMCSASQFCRLADCTCQSNLGVADIAYVDTMTDQVLGWARSATLANYGKSLQCPSFKRDWNPKEEVSSVMGSISQRIAAPPDGTLRAVWVSPGNKIMYRQRVRGIWSGSDGVDISTAAGIVSATTPDMVVQGNKIHLVYVNTSDGIMHYQYCLMTSDCTLAANWIGDTNITLAGPSANPRVAIAPNGDMMLIYQSSDGQIYARIKDKFNIWTNVNSPMPGSTAYVPVVAADYTNNFHVAFYNDSDAQIYYNKYDQTLGSWGAAVQVSDPANYEVSSPDIAVDPAAQPHIVFDTTHWTLPALPNALHDVAYVRHTDQAGWLAEEKVSDVSNSTQDGPPASSYDPRRMPKIAIGTDYIAHVSYEWHNEDPATFYYGNKVNHREIVIGQPWAGSAVNLLANALGTGVLVEITQMVMDQSNMAHAIGTYGNRPYEFDSQAQSCSVAQADPGWGWLSLRGGAANSALGGEGVGSCYDCTDDASGKNCRICETDVALYPAPNDNPPIYACNMCTKCGRCTGDGPNYPMYCSSNLECFSVGKGTCEMRRACRLTGIDCTNLIGSCGGGSNECLPVCQTCTTCNQWGVSMESLGADRGQFHGYAWSAGGDITLDPDQLRAGGYDSGAVEAEASIGFTAGNSCSSLVDCRLDGWRATDGSAVQLCGNATYYGTATGACEIENATPKWFSIPANIPALSGLTDGYYYISFQGRYTNNATPELASIVVNGPNGRIDQLDAADLSDAGPAPIAKECTFYHQVYIEKSVSTFRFQARNGQTVPIDNFRITSLPISRTNCETGADYVAPFTTYTNDVGFGWVDFSNVSMVTPWTQTQFGDVYSLQNIGQTGGAAPAGRYNATFILETGPGSSIIAWSSQASQSSSEYVRAGSGASIFLPKPSFGYANFLGRIDYAGLTEKTSGAGTSVDPGKNQYSKRVVDTFAGDSCDDNTMLWSNIKDQVLNAGVLNGGIYHIGSGNRFCKLVIDQPIEFNNGDGLNPDTKLGNGLFIVEGDLEVNQDITYGAGAVSSTDQLASVGWIVKGNVVVAGDSLGIPVENMVGAYVAIGCEAGNNCLGSLGDHGGIFSTGSTSGTTLYVHGLAMARTFNFERRVMSSDFGAEVFISDGRERANTPPGMASISAALPRDITSVAP